MTKFKDQRFIFLFFVLFIYFLLCIVKLMSSTSGFWKSLEGLGPLGDTFNPFITFFMVFFLLQQIDDARHQHNESIKRQKEEYERSLEEQRDANEKMMKIQQELLDEQRIFNKDQLNKDRDLLEKQEERFSLMEKSQKEQRLLLEITRFEKMIDALYQEIERFEIKYLKKNTGEICFTDIRNDLNKWDVQIKKGKSALILIDKNSTYFLNGNNVNYIEQVKIELQALYKDMEYIASRVDKITDEDTKKKVSGIFADSFRSIMIDLGFIYVPKSKSIINDYDLYL